MEDILKETPDDQELKDAIVENEGILRKNELKIEELQKALKTAYPHYAWMSEMEWSSIWYHQPVHQ